MPDCALIHCRFCHQNMLGKRDNPQDDYACVRCGSRDTAPAVNDKMRSLETARRRKSNKSHSKRAARALEEIGQ